MYILRYQKQSCITSRSSKMSLMLLKYDKKVCHYNTPQFLLDGGNLINCLR
jgi:hypothetical protein